jgi:hypothetical protein
MHILYSLKLRLFLFAFLIVTVETAIPQNISQNIKGRVRDNITGEPLIGANIVIINSNPLKGTVTDSEGKFIINGAKVGNISLRISFMGYKTVEILNREILSGKELIINVFMEEMLITGKEFVVKAGIDKKGSINSMSSVSTRTFTIDETRRYAGSRGDVARMASNYAGVQVASDSRNDIVVRGNSPSGLQWRLEGLEIPNPNHYGAFGTTGGPVSILNNNQLDNSDFLSGAFPAEYGNALSGIFDLRLKTGNTDSHEFMSMVGFNGFEVGAEGPFSKKSDASFIGNFRYSTMEVFSLIGMTFGTGTAVPKYQDFSFKINIPTKKAGVFSFYGMGGKSKIDFLDSERDTTEVEFYGGEGWDLRTGSDLALFGLNHTIALNKSSFIKTSASWSYHKYFVSQDSISPVDKEIIAFYYSNFIEKRVLFSSFYKKRINVKHNFQLGININYYDSNLNDSVYSKSMDEFNILTNYLGNSTLFRPYLAWQFKLSDRLIINAGADFMYYTFNKTSNLEPRFGIIYHSGPTTKISFAYGLHSQLLPTMIYNRESYIGQGQYIAMNKNLDLIKSHHFVFSFDWDLSEFMRLKAEAYYQKIYEAAVNANKNDSYSILNQGADFYIWNPDTLKSTGSGRNYGIELTIEHFLSKGFYVLGTSSLFDSKYKGSDGIEHNTAFNSTFIANFLVGKEWVLHKNSSKPKFTSKRRSIGADLKINWSGGRRYTPINEELSKIEHRPIYNEDRIYEARFPNYFRTDIKVFFKHVAKKSNYEMGIDVQNIFNTRNIYSQNFNTSTGEVYYTYQLGVMVIPYFRFEF